MLNNEYTVALGPVNSSNFFWGGDATVDANPELKIYIYIL